MKPYTRDAVEDDLVAAMRRNDWATVDVLERQLDIVDVPRRVTVLGAALWYANHGLPVFPVQAGKKVPYPRTRGFKDATLNHVQIREWWDQWPDANVAFATGHQYDVVDIDGPAGQAFRAQSWDLFRDLDVVAVVSTPRPGGMHLYVPATGDGNRAGVYPGIDYRGDGGYVLAPPSATPQGTYRFLKPLPL